MALANEDAAILLTHTLRALVHRGATDDDFPWALAHGLLAFGPELKTRDGHLAIDVIAQHAEPEKVEGRVVYRFPLETKAGLPIEPHPDMVARTFSAVGVSPDRALRAKDGERITLDRLANDAEWVFEPPTGAKAWEKFAWSAGLFFDRRGAMEQIKTKNGPLPVHQLALSAMDRLEEEQDFIAHLMEQHAPEQLRKRKQKIYAHSCGGLHLVQSVLEGAALLGDSELLERGGRQLEVLKFRWEAERIIYRKMIAENPEYAPLLLVQELKFYGHLLETFALGARWKAFVPTEDDRRFFRRVVSDLTRTVEELKPSYSAQDALRKASPQTYYDLVGDGCHAIRALQVGRPYFFGEAAPAAR